MSTTRTPVPHRGASTLLGLVPSLAVLVATALLVLSWRPDLPDPVAIHFKPEGPDGFGSVESQVALLLGVFGPVAVGAWLAAVLLGRESMTRRIAVGFGTGMSVFGSVLVGGMIGVQRGLDDAALTPDIDPVITAAVVAGVVVGGLCALLMPRDPRAPATEPGPVDGPRVVLGAHERAVWTNRVVSRAALGVGGLATVGVGASAAVGDLPAMYLLAAGLGALVLATAVVVVTVDGTGLTARSPLGWPRYRIPLDEVVGVAVTQVHPLRDFGGWGYRVRLGGGVGYVVRTGEGIEVERTNGRCFVVTVDDAATGAALLTTLADRARART